MKCREMVVSRRRPVQTVSGLASEEKLQNNPAVNEKKWGGLKITLIILGSAFLASVLTVWLAKAYLFPKDFRPIRLSAGETEILDTKIKALSAPRSGDSPESTNSTPHAGNKNEPNPDLTPERYSESDAQREIRLTERELNGLLAQNTDLARKLAIDLSDDLASAKLLIPLDPDFPFVGGKVLRVSAGMELRYAQQKPVVILRGVSIWGVPIPNAWLGGLKNIDLVSEFGIRKGFWRAFSDGVDHIRIQEGQLSIRLKP